MCKLFDLAQVVVAGREPGDGSVEDADGHAQLRVFGARVHTVVDADGTDRGAFFGIEMLSQRPQDRDVTHRLAVGLVWRGQRCQSGPQYLLRRRT